MEGGRPRASRRVGVLGCLVAGGLLFVPLVCRIPGVVPAYSCIGGPNRNAQVGVTVVGVSVSVALCLLLPSNNVGAFDGR